MLLLALNVALAECEPMDAAGFEERVAAARDALRGQSPTVHQAIVRDIVSRLPCLDFAPAPERWAELLVAMAIADFFLHEPWEPALATALRLHPEVDLLVGRGHPFAAGSRPRRLHRATRCPRACGCTSMASAPPTCRQWTACTWSRSAMPTAGGRRCCSTSPCRPTGSQSVSLGVSGGTSGCS